MSVFSTLLVVGETALLIGEVALSFFFLILIPGTGAEFRASRNPVASIAAVTTPTKKKNVRAAILEQAHCNLYTSPSCEGSYSRCAGMILTLISLAELDGILRGLYFFSSGGASEGLELFMKKKNVNLHKVNIIYLYYY